MHACIKIEIVYNYSKARVRMHEPTEISSRCYYIYTNRIYLIWYNSLLESESVTNFDRPARACMFIY